MPAKARNKIKVEIKAAMRVSLAVQIKDDINGMENVLMLSSVVEEVLEDGRILLQMPIHQGYHYPLPREETFLMHFFTDSEMYALPVIFEERIERGGFVFAMVRRAGRIKPHQRRDCYRFPCSMSVTIERLWIKERERYPERQPTEGRMINVSDGGMQLDSDENIEKGEKLTLTFDLGSVETVEGMVLRSDRIEDGSHLFRVAVRFRNKDKVQKRRIYKLIVDRQQEERRRWTQDLQPLYPPVKVGGD